MYIVQICTSSMKVSELNNTYNISLTRQHHLLYFSISMHKLYTIYISSHCIAITYHVREYSYNNMKEYYIHMYIYKISVLNGVTPALKGRENTPSLRRHTGSRVNCRVPGYRRSGSELPRRLHEVCIVCPQVQGLRGGLFSRQRVVFRER